MRILLVLTAIIIMGLTTLTLHCKAKKKNSDQTSTNSPIILKPGDKAPNFTLKNQDAQDINLYDFIKKYKKVALYFYPMDETPGCTKQACSLRDGFNDLKQAGISILGVSADSVTSHKKFAEKQHLNFTILSDQNQNVAELYNTKRSWWLSWMGTKRVTFLINHSCEIIQILNKIKLKDHADQIIQAFK